MRSKPLAARPSPATHRSPRKRGAAVIVNTALDAFGGLDVVINNAGIHDPGAFSDLPLENFRRMLDVHYLGVVYVLKAAWPHLKKSGSGRVVNTCSEGMAGMHPTCRATVPPRAA